MKLEHAAIPKRARVEMIPLIDCMFILLVFFIYSMLSMTLQRGITVELPRGTTLETNRQTSVVITITEDGALLFDDAPVEIDDLPAAIGATRGGDDPPRFVINADEGSRHGRFVQVMDVLKREGVAEVMILSEEGSP